MSMYIFNRLLIKMFYMIDIYEKKLPVVKIVRSVLVWELHLYSINFIGNITDGLLKKYALVG